MIDGLRPQRRSWLLKAEALPWIYWNGMLRGGEWLAPPRALSDLQRGA
jgi:sulfide:quinone oxidoreductase